MGSFWSFETYRGSGGAFLSPCFERLFTRCNSESPTRELDQSQKVYEWKPRSELRAPFFLYLVFRIRKLKTWTASKTWGIFVGLPWTSRDCVCVSDCEVKAARACVYVNVYKFVSVSICVRERAKRYEHCELTHLVAEWRCIYCSFVEYFMILVGIDLGNPTGERGRVEKKHYYLTPHITCGNTLSLRWNSLPLLERPLHPAVSYGHAQYASVLRRESAVAHHRCCDTHEKYTTPTDNLEQVWYLFLWIDNSVYLSLLVNA